MFRIIAQETDEDLKDFLFTTNKSFREIAEDLGQTEVWVRKRVKDLGLGWVRRSRGYASRGQAALTHLIKRLLPGETVISEHCIGERLFLDIYCPGYQLAAEFHGRQHFEFSLFFHGTMEKFKESQARDMRKEELCKEKGIALVVFRFNDTLTEEAVFDRLLDAIRSASSSTEEEALPKFKGNKYYENFKQRQREYRRESYRKMKRGNGESKRKPSVK